MEERVRPPAWVQAVEVLPLAVGLAFFVCFALTAAIRVQSPFPLGPFDVGFLQHVRRVLDPSRISSTAARPPSAPHFGRASSTESATSDA